MSIEHESEKKGKLSIKERSLLMADWIDSYNICQVFTEGEIFEEHSKKMTHIAEVLGITEILKEEERR